MCTLSCPRGRTGLARRRLRRQVVEEHVLRVSFVKTGEYPAGNPAFAAQQFPHGRVGLVRGGEHAGSGRVPQGGPDEGATDSLSPRGGRDEQQVDEVAVVEVAWPDGKEARDLAVVHGDQAG